MITKKEYELALLYPIDEKIVQEYEKQMRLIELKKINSPYKYEVKDDKKKRNGKN